MQSRDELFDLVEREKLHRVIERVSIVEWDCRCLNMTILTSHLPNGPARAGGRAIRGPLDDFCGVGALKFCRSRGFSVLFYRWPAIGGVEISLSSQINT